MGAEAVNLALLVVGIVAGVVPGYAVGLLHTILLLAGLAVGVIIWLNVGGTK